jgi:hypothetical protein
MALGWQVFLLSEHEPAVPLQHALQSIYILIALARALTKPLGVDVVGLPTEKARFHVVRCFTGFAAAYLPYHA